MSKILVTGGLGYIGSHTVVALQNAGYEVVEASNGLDALNLMKEHPIGLFISDVNMPEMDGITLLKKIKADRDNRHAPVIMLTTENDADMISLGREAGAKAWMIKPFQPEQLVDAVKKLFVS